MSRVQTVLAVPAALFALWALTAQASGDDDLAKRLAPVGQVCVQGQPCTAQSVVASASAGAVRTAEDIVSKHCTACHASGLLDAPKIGDTATWKARADHQGGLDGLLAKAITGLNAMPPKGTCADCSDAELKAAIERMSGL